MTGLAMNRNDRWRLDRFQSHKPRFLAQSWSPDATHVSVPLCQARSSIGYRGWMAIPVEGAKGSISLPKWRLGRMGLWWGVVRSQDSYVVPRARMIEPRCGTLISTLNRLWEKYIVIIRYFVYFFVCFMCFCLCSHSTMHICMHVCFFHTHTRTRTLHTHTHIYICIYMRTATGLTFARNTRSSMQECRVVPEHVFANSKHAILILRVFAWKEDETEFILNFDYTETCLKHIPAIYYTSLRALNWSTPQP